MVAPGLEFSRERVDRRSDRPSKPLGSQAVRTTERSEVVRALETKFLLFWAGRGQDTVLPRSPAPRPPQPVSLASLRQRRCRRQLGRSWPRRLWSPLPSFRHAPPSKQPQPECPCQFASGEASASERLRLPPQVDPQPTHPVRQNIAWHPEVGGDIAVRLPEPRREQNHSELFRW